MDYLTLQKTLSKYGPANSLNNFIPLRWRKRINNLLINITFILFLLSLVSPVYLPEYQSLIFGFALLFFSLSILSFCVNSFFYDLYFSDLTIAFKEAHFKSSDQSGSYFTSEIISKTKDDDVVSGLFHSFPGEMLFARLGIPTREIKSFILNRKNKITKEQFKIQTDLSENLFVCYVMSLYKLDAEFKDFVFKFSVRESDLKGAIEWITKQFEREKREVRWWGKDNLSKTNGIGRDWSYGEVYVLEKYAQKIEDEYDFSVHGLGHHKKQVDQIESILSRKNEANALLVSDDDLQKIDILVEFSKRVSSDKSLTIKNKLFFVLNLNNVIVGKKSKAEYESEIISIFNGVQNAGNIILIIKDFPEAIQNSKALNSNILELIAPYLSSPVLQIIALSDIKNFHQYIENEISTMEKFEVLLLKEDSEENLVYTLEKKANSLEHKFGVWFTYQSLVSIAENANRYFSGQIIADKANDMLVELPLFVLRQNKKTITPKEVSEIVQTKTGIPTGEIQEKEKNKLLNIEKILHERVISQDEAISAIGSTLRRVRSGIESKNKPLGSFLFLGPTGVGKTETAKALSEVFFDNDEKIIRLDMSEYNSSDSLSKLLGSFETNKQGVLTSLLRENQYGVLLLDEFEKANYEVHNLFLQILDEGIFSDMAGKKVNARNLIIIATSNAGSDIIWDYTKTKRGLADNKQDLIDKIVRQGTFRPELINRFDGVILFHPLNNEHLKQIASLMLKKLSKRLEEKSLELNITDELINYLVKKGSDPMFGARPINRAIQDNVEEIIARKIINGEANPGSKLTITKEELDSIDKK